MNTDVDSFMWDNALKNAFKNIFIYIELCCGTPLSKVESFF